MINNYITLDGNKYCTNSTNWLETEYSPRQTKRLLSSAGDVTFGVNSFFGWTGDIFIDLTPASGFGSMSDFQTTFRKKTSLSMTDHYGVTRTVVLGGQIQKRSILPIWDDPTNEFHIPVEIMTI